jgi:hypothetical protein
MTLICICSMFFLVAVSTANAARVGLLRVGGGVVPFSSSSGGTLSSRQQFRHIETSRTLRDEEFDVYVPHTLMTVFFLFPYVFVFH